MTQVEHGQPASAANEGIAIVVLTYGRVHLLRQCVENVLTRTSSATREILIWDNGSTDGTSEYLASLDDRRLRVVRRETNEGLNAYAKAVALTTAPFLIELDDDIVDAPPEWDHSLLKAYHRLPNIGLLAASLVDDPNDPSARAMHHLHQYVEVEEHGVRLLHGPTGGGCALTSRQVYEHVGGFPRVQGEVFFDHDAAYVRSLEQAGYQAVTLADLIVHHAGGLHYSDAPNEKLEFWRSYHRRVVRKQRVKRVLLRVPVVAALNARHRWFTPPDETPMETELARPWLEDAPPIEPAP